MPPPWLQQPHRYGRNRPGGRFIGRWPLDPVGPMDTTLELFASDLHALAHGRKYSPVCVSAPQAKLLCAKEEAS
jgi:hypothetical protein